MLKKQTHFKWIRLGCFSEGYDHFPNMIFESSITLLFPCNKVETKAQRKKAKTSDIYSIIVGNNSLSLCCGPMPTQCCVQSHTIYSTIVQMFQVFGSVGWCIPQQFKYSVVVKQFVLYYLKMWVTKTVVNRAAAANHIWVLHHSAVRLTGFITLTVDLFVCRYPLAVTRHKDSEATSSSMYTQNDPWEPAVSFEDYIRNNEDIVNQVQ